VAISLGREFTLSIAGSEVTGVRDVTINQTANEITFQEYGSREVNTYTTGYSYELSFESMDSNWFNTAYARLESGFQVQVIITDSASTTVWSFDAVVTSVSDSQPLDGVRSVQTTLKLYFFDSGSPLRLGDTNP